MAASLTLPLDSTQIEKYIPHRYPFLMLDTIEEVELGQKIVATKKAESLEVILKGHFPGNPIVPGVLMVEGAAQAACVLTALTYFGGQFSTCYLTEVTSARFRRIVKPGDVMRYEVLQTRCRQPFLWFDAKVCVGNDVAASLSFSAQMK